MVVLTNCDRFRVKGTDASLHRRYLALDAARPLAHRLQVPLQVVEDVAGDEHQAGQLAQGVAQGDVADRVELVTGYHLGGGSAGGGRLRGAGDPGQRRPLLAGVARVGQRLRLDASGGSGEELDVLFQLLHGRGGRRLGLLRVIHPVVVVVDQRPGEGGG